MLKEKKILLMKEIKYPLLNKQTMELLSPASYRRNIDFIVSGIIESISL